MMVQRWGYGFKGIAQFERGEFVKYEDYAKLEAENARLRRQRDAANAQMDLLMEEVKTR